MLNALAVQLPIIQSHEAISKRKLALDLLPVLNMHVLKYRWNRSKAGERSFNAASAAGKDLTHICVARD